MRAWQVWRHGEPTEALQLVEADPPEPGPGFVRVRVKAAALGLPDVFMCRGVYALTPKLPFTPGQELAGVVTAVGEGAPVEVGQRIMAVSGFPIGHGGFAEETLALAAQSFVVPDAMSDEEAAGFLIPYHTAWVGLVHRGRLRDAETLLVLGGAGGTGAAAIQLGRALGARVLATASGAERVAYCRELGADFVIDRRAADVSQSVKEATDGRGVDVVYDTVGGDAFRDATRCIAQEGRVLTVGFASGSWGQISAGHVTAHNYSVIGVYPGSYDRAFWLESREQLLGLHRQGRIRAPVGRVAPFDELPEALTELASGSALGKVILSV